MKKIYYNTKDIDIQNFFIKLFEYPNLEKLHIKFTDDNLRELFTPENDNTTYFHKIFYKNKHLFEPIYFEIIKKIYFEEYKNEEYIVYQTFPALRVSIPNNISVGELHCDYDYNHPEEEMNYWLPITKVNNINTVYYESKENKGDFQPLLINYGEIAKVYFNKCRHFSKINTTNDMRLSLDFRIIPGSKWNNINVNKKTKFANIKFSIGNYFNKFEPTFIDYFSNSYYQNNLVCCKLFHYFRIYDEIFKCKQFNSINILEIGIKLGGSIQLFKNYFKNLNQYIGIDINNDCKKYEKIFNNVKILIGDQENIDFLNNLDINQLDIIIDDGGNQFKQQINSFNVLFHKLNEDGIYLIEDTHSSYDNYSNIYPKDNVYNGGRFKKNTTIEYFKRLSDEVTAWAYTKKHNTCPLYKPHENSWINFIKNNNLNIEKIDYFRENIYSITFYDSIIVIKKKKKIMPHILFNNNNNQYTFHDKLI